MERPVAYADSKMARSARPRSRFSFLAGRSGFPPYPRQIAPLRGWNWAPEDRTPRRMRFSGQVSELLSAYAPEKHDTNTILRIAGVECRAAGRVWERAGATPGFVRPRPPKALPLLSPASRAIVAGSLPPVPRVLSPEIQKMLVADSVPRLVPNLVPTLVTLPGNAMVIPRSDTRQRSGFYWRSYPGID